MKIILVSFFILTFFSSRAQQNGLSGIVEDSKTHELLAGASITIYQSSKILGGISNGEGRFSVSRPGELDSVRFSMIGYRNRVYKPVDLKEIFLIVILEPEPSVLEGIVVRPMSPLEIVRQAAHKIPSLIPSGDFESKAFYREIIQDSERYYSIAEALFDIQYAVQKKSFKLRLLKGRSKEDVAYTRLFEDFHPGGGPEDAAGQSLIIRRPEFLEEGKLKNYNYKKDSTIRWGDRDIYVIGFDQKPDIHEALEKGEIFIDADDFSILKFEAWNSPAGTPYIKSLRGADKIFAELLHIDLTVKGWARSAAFTKIGDKLFLGYANMEYKINYKQPKKALDLDLAIHTDLLITDFQHPIIHEITKSEEWKRKNLVAHLPTDFDSTFWGANNILDPTAKINNIISSISEKNNDSDATTPLEDWLYLNKDFFVAHKNGDSIAIVPIAKCSWEDKETGGMLYKNIKGNFNIETRLSVKKRSAKLLEPDNGFQQSGIIIRSAAGEEENNVIVSLGTGGNSIPKYFLKRTTNGRTKGLVEKTDSLTGWFRMEKRNKIISVYKRPSENSQWTKIDDYELGWLEDNVQVGFTVMARFAGDGTKQRPDIKAIFSKVQITNP